MTTSPSRARAHTRYEANGAQVPSVTTIIEGSLGWNKGQLIAWANKQGLAGLDCNKTKEIAGQVGTIAHLLVQHELQGKAAPELTSFPPEDVAAARVAYDAFVQWWWSGIGFKVEASEIAVVNEKERYGGTIDLLARDGAGDLWLIDLKTGKGLYPEHIIQVAAYQRCRPDATRVKIVRLDKETGAVSEKNVPKKLLAAGWRAFKALRQLHDLKRVLA